MPMAMLFILALRLMLFINFCACGQSLNQTENISGRMRLNIGFVWQKSKFQHPVFSAFQIGVRSVKQQVHGYDIHYGIEDTSCNSKIGMKAALKLKKKYHHMDGIIGSRCSVVCEPVGLWAAALNIPLVSAKCNSNKLSDKKNYPTFTSARGYITSSSMIVFLMLQKLGWTTFSIITSDLPLFKLAADQPWELSKEHGMNVQLFTFSSTVKGYEINQEKVNTLRLLLHGLKYDSRITLMYDADARNFLILAKYEGILSENHVFIGFDSVYRGTLIAVKNIEPELSDTVVYEGVIAITEDDVPKTEEWKKFQNEIALSLLTKNYSQDQIEIVLKKAEPYTGERQILSTTV